MKYKLLGNTGLQVSELCLGTMTFGGGGMWSVIGALGQKEANAIMEKAINSGINFIDTANIYSNGLSEKIVGQSVKDLSLERDDLILATKVWGKTGDKPNQSGLSRKHIFHQIDESLTRLQTDYIDLYQIHGYDELTPIEETMDAMDELVKAGKIRYAGSSNLSAWQIMKALDYSKFQNKSRFISLQAYYSLAGRDIERELILLLLDQNIGLMVWSPLAGGFLTGKYTKNNNGNSENRRMSFDFPPINKERAHATIELLKLYANEKNVTTAQLSIAWLLEQKAVSTVIIGVKTLEQLEDNLKSVAINFTPEELNALNEISALPKEYPGWFFEQ